MLGNKKREFFLIFSGFLAPRASLGRSLGALFAPLGLLVATLGLLLASENGSRNGPSTKSVATHPGGPGTKILGLPRCGV